MLVSGQEEEDPLCGDVYTEHKGNRDRGDPVGELGGLQNIDKITRIEVDTAHNLLFCTDLRVFGRIFVTYRLKDGSTQRKQHGAGGHCQNTGLPAYDIPEGVYLTGIRGYDGTHIAWVEFTMSDGAVWKPFSQPARGTPNFDYNYERGVIKAVSKLILCLG